MINDGLASHAIVRGRVKARAGAKLAAALLAFIAALSFATLVYAVAAIPALTGRVVDAAGLLSSSEAAALTQKLAAFEAKSSDQIVVATVPSLDGEDIASYANRMFRTWKLGQAGEDNGVLVLVAPNDRKMRIEVGYGLEGTLTDVHSSLIIQDMAQRFRAGDFAGGINLAADDVVKVLEGQGAELEARAKRNQREEGGGPDTIVLIFFALWFCLIAGSILMSVLPRMFGREIAPGKYRWLGRDYDYTRRSRPTRNGGWVVTTGGGGFGGGGGWSGGGGGGFGGGFSGGGGSSGGGGASGGW